jgi:hypothetical protein
MIYFRANFEIGVYKYILEPFTDLTFPKENILPEEKKNSWIHGKNFEYERLSISACEHARVL